MPPRVVTATDAEVLSNSQAEERQQDQSPIKLPSKCDGSVPWKEEHSQGDDLKDDNSAIKGCANERVSKYIKSEAGSFSPNYSMRLFVCGSLACWSRLDYGLLVLAWMFLYATFSIQNL